MQKTYFDFMNEITPDELYDRLIQYGLFSEKLPPIFDCGAFLQYCKNQNKLTTKPAPHQYVVYRNMRNINIPRIIGIPTPMAHERICACLSKNWDYLLNYFKEKTLSQKHIVSRIHIRKMKETNSLFVMNYKNWKIDGTPDPDISLGKKYLVKADISTCFPSIYTHAIPWALVTKEIAKKTIKNKVWYNDLDLFVRNSTNGETHGILIGPHTSNIISEIILCAIDAELQDEFAYVRKIDDYTCYVDTMEEAENFLLKLDSCLRHYNLTLNHKKTEIKELPVGAIEQWSRKIQDRTAYFNKFQMFVDYKEVQAFIDFCIELMAKNNNDAAILFYGIKVLLSYNLSPNAKTYVTKIGTSLALNLPYIVPLLDLYIYKPYKIGKSQIDNYINLLYDRYIEKNQFETTSFALYLATKYDVVIKNFQVNDIIAKNDYILSLCCLIYCRRIKLQNELKKMKLFANHLIKNDYLESQWLFIYECLTTGYFKDEWRKLKKNNVSFLKKEFQ